MGWLSESEQAQTTLRTFGSRLRRSSILGPLGLSQALAQAWVQSSTCSREDGPKVLEGDPVAQCGTATILRKLWRPHPKCHWYRDPALEWVGSAMAGVRCQRPDQG